jgi:hypothetical protein
LGHIDNRNNKLKQGDSALATDMRAPSSKEIL